MGSDLLSSRRLHLLHLQPHSLLLLHLLKLLFLCLQGETVPVSSAAPGFQTRRLANLALYGFRWCGYVRLGHATGRELASRLLVHLVRNSHTWLLLSIVLSCEVRCSRALVVVTDSLGSSTWIFTWTGRGLAHFTFFGILGRVSAIMLGKLAVSCSAVIRGGWIHDQVEHLLTWTIDGSLLFLLVDGQARVWLLHLSRYTLELLLSRIALLLQAIKLVMLQQDTLLNHWLIWLGKEVVLFNIVLVLTTDHFSHVSLQIVTLQNFLAWLLRWYLADLLLVHAWELLCCALLHRIWLQAVHIVSRTYRDVLTLLVGPCRSLPSLICVLDGTFSAYEGIQMELLRGWPCYTIITPLFLYLRAFLLWCCWASLRQSEIR